MFKLLFIMILSGCLMACTLDVGGKQERVSQTDGKQELSSQVESAVISPPPILAAGEKMAHCVIKPNKYDGPCVFRLGRKGSFSLSKADDSYLFSDISLVSVSIVGSKESEVRGLTSSGINSRWGSAVRSDEDPACWKGSDFEVCAYASR